MKAEVDGRMRGHTAVGAVDLNNGHLVLVDGEREVKIARNGH